MRLPFTAADVVAGAMDRCRHVDENTQKFSQSKIFENAASIRGEDITITTEDQMVKK